MDSVAFSAWLDGVRGLDTARWSGPLARTSRCPTLQHTEKTRLTA